MKPRTKSAVDLAYQAIQETVLHHRLLSIQPDDVSQDLRHHGASFVTIFVDEKLRGCIGTIEAYQPLYLDIIKNATGTVTRDWRFSPPSPDELDPARFHIHVSLLTPLKPYNPASSAHLLSYLTRHHPGLVIEKMGHRAVFLPDVWQQIPDARQFLAQLCLKADLPLDAWQEDMRFQTFTTTAS